MGVNTMTVEKGDTVTWQVSDSDLFGRKASGTVIETNLSLFGYDDIIAVDSPTDPNDVTHIRPKDII